MTLICKIIDSLFNLSQARAIYKVPFENNLVEALPIELRIYLSMINPEFRIYENPRLWANWVVNPQLKVGDLWKILN